MPISYPSPLIKHIIYNFEQKHYIDNTLHINYLNKIIANRPHTKFLGLMVDDNLTWNNHIDQLISKLNSACYAIRAVNAMLTRKGLRILYFSYVHSIIPYGIILGGLDMNREWKKIEFPKRVLYMNLETTRLRGRPRNRWQDEVREDGRK